jgi:ribosomal protein L16 Arg81 hydroxylase
MSNYISSLAELLDPMTPETFCAEYLHKKPLHVRGHPEKFASTLTWAELNRMLEMDVWTQQTLLLNLDTNSVPPAAYCVKAANRDHQPIMRPDPDKVQALMGRGATLGLNEIETLAPGILALVHTIQRELGAKSSVNLYYSQKEHKGFDAHSDRHDVFAVQIFGTKRWNLYEGQLDRPIEHTMFQNVPQMEYDRRKGKVAEVLEMNPGDLLYLPRGKFHDALTSGDLSVHLAVASNEPLGLDWLTQLWNLAVRDPEFRAVLPYPEGPSGEQALHDHLRRLHDRLGTIAFDDQSLRMARNLRGGYGLKRGRYHLPDLPDAGAVPRLAEPALAETA